MNFVNISKIIKITSIGIYLANLELQDQKISGE